MNEDIMDVLKSLATDVVCVERNEIDKEFWL